MSKIAIITDTDSSLPEEVAAQAGIYQVPVTVHFGQESYESNYQINDTRLFERIDREGRLPTTAAPSPGKFVEAYQAAFDAGAEGIVCICVSSQVSATYAAAVTACEEFPNRSVIVDTSWGTGRLTSWEQVARIRRPFVLSGGLTADNVADAICILRPLGVDVCSGVERSPGRKDPEKLSRFLAAVRNSVCLAGADERKGSRR